MGWLFFVFASLVGSTKAETGLIPQSVAQSHGLKRAWYAQVHLDRSRDEIAYVTQYGGVLYLQTTHAQIHALDAETGRNIWSKQVGNSRDTSLAPGVNDDLLAVINGSTLFVIDRVHGQMKLERPLENGAGAGPALGKNWLFVPMVTGMIKGYNLLPNHAKDLPWIYQSSGRILIQPVITEASVAWTTSRGNFYVADLSEEDKPRIRFRIETKAEISSPPAHWSPFLYACSLDGFLYAVNEVTGETWSFSSGGTMSKQPVAVGGNVYVLPDRGGMYCLAGDKNQEHWFAPNVVHFLAASPDRVYAVDHLKRLVTLDAKSGSPLDWLPLGDVQFKLINQQTDRVYLFSDSGLVQCLHEVGRETPHVYTPPPLPKKAALLHSEADKKKEAAPPIKPSVAPPVADEPSADEMEEESIPADESEDPDKPFG